MSGDVTYTDLLYEESDEIATITINRPEKLNAFRGKTCDELIDALNRSAWDSSIGVIVLTGAERSAPAATSRRMTAATTGAARSGCRWRRCTT
jgi:1,4-dihydroxy-2-naphthoyl-CoA synthase